MPTNQYRNKILYDEDAEKSVICCMLADENIASKGLEFLNQDFFYSRRCNLIFKCIKELYNEREKIDTITVRDKILKKTEKELLESGIKEKTEIDVSYFSDITSMPVLYTNFESYCNIVKDVYLRRKTNDICNQLAIDSIKNETDVKNIIYEAQRQFFELSKEKGEKEFEYLNEIMPEVLTKMDEAANIKGGLIGIPSGFKALDDLTQGFQKQDLIIIAARPSTGKTSLALNFAYNMSKANKKVAFFSLEMGGVSLGQRLLSMESGISSENIRSGKLSMSDWERAALMADEISRLNITINTNSYLTIAELRSKCRKLQSDSGLDCIIIDYLQLMHAGIESYNGNKNFSKLINNRQEEVAEISRSLKGLAKELDIPVISLAQLSRNNADGKRETELSDIRESGAIEQDADLVMFIEKKNYKDDPNDPNGEKSDTVYLNIKKHRNGRTKKIELRFDKATTKFNDLE